MTGRDADGDPSPKRDPHPELSAPIVDLSLEAQIARAEQAVKDRDTRVRSGARRIGEIARSGRGVFVKRAAVIGAIGLAVGAGYAGYKAFRSRKPGSRGQPHRHAPSEARKAFEFADLAVIARIGLQWALKLQQQQGLVGSIFGAVRQAVWPGHAGASQASPPFASDTVADPVPADRTGLGDGFR